MALHIDIQTNINDNDLTLETCSEIIKTLQSVYKYIRQEIYAHFLGYKNLKRVFISASIVLFFYFLTNNYIFVYALPTIAITTMIIAIISAEYMARQSRKEITRQLHHYIKKREALLQSNKSKDTLF